jgi:hypothetical protein
VIRASFGFAKPALIRFNFKNRQYDRTLRLKSGHARTACKGTPFQLAGKNGTAEAAFSLRRRNAGLISGCVRGQLSKGIDLSKRANSAFESVKVQSFQGFTEVDRETKKFSKKTLVKNFTISHLSGVQS